jgi:hypothetical protein
MLEIQITVENTIAVVAMAIYVIMLLKLLEWYINHNDTVPLYLLSIALVLHLSLKKINLEKQEIELDNNYTYFF